jgi:hypothetical protein
MVKSKSKNIYVGFEVPAMVVIKEFYLLDITSCGLVKVN